MPYPYALTLCTYPHPIRVNSKIYGPKTENKRSLREKYIVLWQKYPLKIFGPLGENIRSAKIYGPYLDS